MWRKGEVSRLLLFIFRQPLHFFHISKHYLLLRASACMRRYQSGKGMKARAEDGHHDAVIIIIMQCVCVVCENHRKVKKVSGKIPYLPTAKKYAHARFKVLKFFAIHFFLTIIILFCLTFTKKRRKKTYGNFHGFHFSTSREKSKYVKMYKNTHCQCQRGKNKLFFLIKKSISSEENHPRPVPFHSHHHPRHRFFPERNFKERKKKVQ